MIYKNSMDREPGRSAGFTVVETLIAMAVFSVIMLVLVVGVMRMTKSYMAGVNRNATQSATRAISDMFGQELQFNAGINTLGTEGGNTVKYFCIGNSKYAYTEGIKYTSSTPTSATNVGLAVMTNPSSICTAPLAADYTNARQMLGNNMRLTFLEVAETSQASGSRQVKVGVAFGDADLFCRYDQEAGAGSSTCDPIVGSVAYGDDIRCKTGSGSEFCAVSFISAYVQRRL